MPKKIPKHRGEREMKDEAEASEILLSPLFTLQVVLFQTNSSLISKCFKQAFN
jgi:hypothetical protein